MMEEKERMFLEWMDGVVLSYDKGGLNRKDDVDFHKGGILQMYFIQNIFPPWKSCSLHIRCSELRGFLSSDAQTFLQEMMRKHFGWEIEVKNIHYVECH